MNKKEHITYILTDQLQVNRIVRGDVENKTYAKKLKRLSRSIKSRGIMTPLIVSSKSNKYEIIDGNRRFEAGCLIGLTNFPCIIKDNINNNDDEEITLLGFSTNEMRSDLKPSQEVEALQRVLENGDLDLKKISNATGKSISQLRSILQRKGLDEQVSKLVDKGDISPSTSKKLSSLNKEEQRDVVQSFKDLDLPISGNTIDLYKGTKSFAHKKISAKIKKQLVENIGTQAEETEALKKEYRELEKDINKAIDKVKLIMKNSKTANYISKKYPDIYKDFNEMIEYLD